MQEEKRKREEREKKKAEVRARLEAASAKSQKKKGFMTPERKKRLRVSIHWPLTGQQATLSRQRADRTILAPNRLRFAPGPLAPEGRRGAEAPAGGQGQRAAQGDSRADGREKEHRQLERG